MQFVSSLPTFADDTAAQRIWNALSLHLAAHDGYCFYKHPLLPSATSDAPDLTILARDLIPIVVVILRAERRDIAEANPDTWIISGVTCDPPLLQLEDFVLGLRGMFSRDRHLRLIPPAIGVLAAPLISRGDLSSLIMPATSYVNTIGEPPIGVAAGEDFDHLVRRFTTDDKTWLRAKSVFQGASVLNRSTLDSSSEPNIRLGTTISALEREIALFDDDQLRVAIQMAPGPQRIRGLAGTGKTVVLAMKAAHAHARYPNERILFTFHTQSLYNQSRNLITRFYRTFRDVDPNWELLHVRHSWGSRARPGVYSDVCRQLQVAPLTFRQAASLDPQSPLRACCNHVLQYPITPQYDYIIADEAQDFPSEYCQLLARLVTEHRRIYFAYDELQSLTSVEIPSPELLFGSTPDGKPFMRLDGEDYPGSIEKDFMLRKSYRCPRDVLVLAHGLGMGIHGPNEVVQMISDRSSWESIGYEVRGDLTTGSNVTLTRLAENSPNRIAQLYAGEQPFIRIESFAKRSDEFDWVANSIADDIHNEGVSPEDIVVISLDSINARTILPAIQRLLVRYGIQSTVPGFMDLSSEFAEPGRVTLSTVYRAKGNEAPLVYIIAFDNLYSYTDEIENRNRAFTSISRAKGWVRITGSGDRMVRVKNELELLQRDLPSLKFIFPDMRKLGIRRLDASETSRRRKELKRVAGMAERLAAVDRQLIEELDPETLEKLRSLLRNHRESE